MQGISALLRRIPALPGARLDAVCVALVALLALGGCATRPVNPPLAHADHKVGYRFEAREHLLRDRDNLVILAFSGGGTRAAAFSYGVLEALRNIEVDAPGRGKVRAIDEVGVITGVSGGSFTALAYGLYGDKLFDQYEKRFLKRNVEGELFGRVATPTYWGSLMSTGWGRSELAADFYDEILFNGATFADLQRRDGPMIIAAATDVSSGARFYYTQTMFDIICSDLAGVRLARAAASSSAVPVVFSPVTFDNYGGSCGFREPPWLENIADARHPVRPAARSKRQLADMRLYEDSKDRPYIHLVDGGVADNLGIRGVLDVIDEFEALRLLGQPTPIDHYKRIAVVVVNSLSSPSTDWDKHVDKPGTFDVFMQATAVPIDHYSFEAIELLRDTAARWKTMRGIRDSGAISDKSSPALLEVMRSPGAELYVVDVSFAALGNADERDYLNQLPTTFVLPDEAVDRLRAAAGRIMYESPEFRRLLADIAATAPTGAGAPASRP
jgi:NTE family protein